MFYSEWLSRSELLLWPMIGLVIFFIAFLIVLARVFGGMRKNREALHHVATLPLDEEESPLPGDFPKGAAR